MRVGDFGLSRDVYAHLYYRADKHSKIPVKWSAPETLNDGLCTEKSDVVGWHFLYIIVRQSYLNENVHIYPVVIWSGVLGSLQSGEHTLPWSG